MLHVHGASERLRRELIEAFTFSNPAYEQAARFSPWGPPKLIAKTVCLATNDNGVVQVPRGIMPHAQLSEQSMKEFNRIKWVNKTRDNPVKFPPLQVTLNEEQNTLIKGARDAFEKGTHPFGNFLFISPTSTGKSIAQATIAAKLGQRTLVLCLTNTIKRSWQEDIAKAFDIRGSDLGIIQQKTWRIGKNFTLASVKTLAQRTERWPELFDQIGCIILDEADTITAPSIFNFIFGFPARYVVGATATPTGRGNNFYLTSAFGPVVKRVAASQKDTKSSFAVQEAEPIYTNFEYEYQQGNINLHDLTEHLMTDEKRNARIVNRVRLDIKNGLVCLVATKRVGHVEILAEMLKEKGIKCRTLTGETNSSGETTELTYELIFNGKCRCLIATTAAILRGANINPLSSLHVTMPQSKKDMEQLAGRIRRRHKDKTRCVIRYYVDRNVGYCFNVYKREAVSAFRTLKIPAFKEIYMA